MFTVEQRSIECMGFTWFEVFENGKTTGESYNALDEAHAVSMHKQFKKWTSNLHEATKSLLTPGPMAVIHCGVCNNDKVLSDGNECQTCK